MGNLSDDTIRWILDLDAKGAQSELRKLSEQTRKFEDDNRRMNAEIKAAEKQMKEAEKEMIRLSRAGLINSNAYREAERTYHSASNEIASYRQRIQENTRAIQENNQVHNEIIRTMRIEDMTMVQLEQRARSLEQQLRNTSEAAEPEAYASLRNELTQVRNRMGEVNNSSRSMSSIFKGGLAVFTGNLMTKALDNIKEWFNTAKEFVAKGIEMAKGAEGVVMAFEKLENSKQYLEDIRKATKSTISDLKLMEKTVRADEMGIGIQNMANLMKFAQQQAKTMKTDVDYMANSIVDGLGRKSTLILDNLGISATQVQQEVKKTGDFTAAVLKIVTKRLEEQGNEALTGAEKAAQAGAKWENAQLKVGQKFLWLGNTWDTISGNIADGISKMVGETRTANEVFDDQLEKVAKLNVETVPLIDKYEELSEKVKLNYDQTKDLNPEQEELLSVINQIKDAIPGVVTEFDKYGRAIGINTEKAREFIQTQIAMLKYMNRDAIDETKENIDEYTTRIDLLKKAKAKGGYDYTIGGSGTSPGTQVHRSFSPEELAEIENSLSQLEQLRTGAQERLKQINGEALDEQVKNNEARIRQQNTFNEMTKEQLDTWIKNEKNANNEYLELAKRTYKSRFGSNGDGSGDSGSKTDKVLLKEKKDLSTMLENLEVEHNKNLTEINQSYLDGEIKTTAELNRKLHEQEQKYYINRISSLQNYKDKATKLEVKNGIDKLIAQQHNEQLSKEISFRQKLEKIIIDADPTKKEEERYKEALSAYELYGETKESLAKKITEAQTESEKNALQLKYDAFLLLEKEHQDKMKSIKDSEESRKNADAEKKFKESFVQRKEELQQELNDLQNIAATNPNFSTEMDLHLQRMKMIQEELNARKEAGLESSKATIKLLKDQGKLEAQMSTTIRKELEKRVSQFQQYGTSVGQALGNVITGQETALKAFGDASIDIVFDVVSKIIEAELIKVMASSTSSIMRATAEAMATPQSALTFGASGFATAAILTGAITAATVAAKAALKGLLGNSKSSSSSSTSTSSKSTGSMSVAKRGYADGGFHGGYTGDGNKYDVKGFFPDGEPYHAGEYIIPKEVLKLPWVGNIVREIEIARVNKTTRNTLPDGFAEGGYHANKTDGPNTNGNTLSMDNGMMTRFIEAVEKLEKKEFKGYWGMTEYQALLNDLNNETKLFTKKS